MGRRYLDRLAVWTTADNNVSGGRITAVGRQAERRISMMLALGCAIMRIKKVVLLICVSAACILFNVSPAAAAPFQSTVNFTGGFHITQRSDGTRDYYFTPVNIDSTLADDVVQVTSLDMTITGQNTQPVSFLNWDLETFIGPSDFGLPEGQFVSAIANTVDNFPRNAPVYNHITPQVTSFSYHYDFPAETTPNLTLSDGLHDQMFFWTGNTLGPYIVFDSVSLTVNGNVIPEPSTLLLAVGATGLLVLRRNNRLWGSNRAK
ncbi:MAG: PEP-CTERM sorting domain-containing protein [Tepidisphaeraceae bacterium]|jgi:hypothetical protein